MNGCEVCEDGWEWVDFEGRGTVTRCRNGCLPEKLDDRKHVPAVKSDAGDAWDWIRFIREDREKRAMRRSEIGDEAYMRERGVDPEKHYMREGMILAKPPPSRRVKGSR